MQQHLTISLTGGVELGERVTYLELKEITYGQDVLAYRWRVDGRREERNEALAEVTMAFVNLLGTL